MKKNNFLSLIISLFLIVGLTLNFSGCDNTIKNNNSNSNNSLTSEVKDSLNSWNDESPTKEVILDFVRDITTQSSENFVPIEDRYATFDMDGTIVKEYTFCMEFACSKYVIEKYLPNNAELVSNLNDLTNIILNIPQYEQPADTRGRVIDLTTKAFSNFTQEESINLIKEFLQTPDKDFDNLTYAQSFYKPMIELIEYLQKNDFTVCIVSDSEREVVRAATEEILNLRSENILGGDTVIKPYNLKEGEDEASYIFKPNDKIVRGIGFSNGCDGLNKVYKIQREIGKTPILAFGNSKSDFSMLNYVMSNTKYKTCTFLLFHDDNTREIEYNSNNTLGQSFATSANEYGWHCVSMKDEFKQVFLADEATKKQSNENTSSAA